jgi:uncharacterized integral membrane protein (TIGR00698 family)
MVGLAPEISARTGTRWSGARIFPGVLLCVAITAVSIRLQSLETLVFGRSWLEALVIAILLGTAIRTFWAPSARWTPGIAFSAKTLLEVAILLLGATISGRMIADIGLVLLFGIAGVVVVAITCSYALGRLFGLPRRMATLIACGNAICGNSAIAAVAPVIGAESDDVAASIAFTAVLGVVVVLTAPVLAIAWHMTPRAFGVFAGLTVYAVPQVLAATAPISSISAQVGALVKLVRVLMLGPVVLVLSLIMRRSAQRKAEAACVGTTNKAPRASFGQLVPWFIVGFLALVAARSFGLLPTAIIPPVSQATGLLTIVSMAALGLGVDVRVIARTGPRVIAVVTLSLVVLGAVAMALIHGVGLY